MCKSQSTCCSYLGIRSLINLSTNSIWGLKAAIHNPNVSEPAKKAAKEKLRQLEAELGEEEEEEDDNDE